MPNPYAPNIYYMLLALHSRFLSPPATPRSACRAPLATACSSLGDDEQRLRSCTDLLESLQHLPGFTSAPLAVKPSHLGGGLGLFVTAPVAAGDVVLSVPLSSCISTPDTYCDGECGPLLQRVAASHGEITALAGWLAKQRVCGDGPTAFLDSLPWAEDDEPTHFLWWSDAEVAAHLSGAARLEAELLRSEAAAQIRRLRRALLPGVQERIFTRAAEGAEELSEEQLLALPGELAPISAHLARARLGPRPSYQELARSPRTARELP